MRKVIEKQLKFERERSKLESDDGFLLFKGYRKGTAGYIVSP